MKKLLLILASIAFLAACDTENFKYAGGNQMTEGSRTYNYALVKSQVTGEKYYHISGWKEYGPEGGTAYMESYVGLELQLYTSKDVVYYYEPGLMYMLSKNYNAKYGTVIE